jgi:hypothetical protein
LTSILKEKLSYIISCFIIWENFETQNTFSDSLYNVPTKENQGQMQIALPVCLKQTKGEKPTNLTKNATKYSIPEKTMVALYKKKRQTLKLNS